MQTRLDETSYCNAERVGELDMEIAGMEKV